MKNLIVSGIFSVVSLVAISSTASARPTLPKITNPKIVVVSGPELAAVQPTVWLEFEFASCSKLTFTPSIRRSATAIRVGATLPEDYVDCLGPTLNRTYSVQLNSDFRQESYIIINSVTPEFRSPSRPDDNRMCTMIAGMLVGPSGECVGFTNGCQLHAMRAQGFEFPQNGECSN
ncbi:MAG: hypothetical protein NT027_10565 [Proteobacteria bacterium]|nr:hypothetical protein [Pseudomonadota bacterium]